jgi:uncharacterized protein
MKPCVFCGNTNMFVPEDYYMPHEQVCRKDILLKNHVEVMSFVRGSHNYNLQVPSSDVDKLVFVLPTFDDLYNKQEFFHQMKTLDGKQDYQVYDLRKLPHLLWKANPTNVEILFSVSIQWESPRFQTLYDFLTRFKDALARMNLPYLFDSAMGTAMNNWRSVERDLVYVSPQDPMDKPYDGKTAMLALRVLNLLITYYESGFTDFRKALWYHENRISRSYLLAVRESIPPFADVKVTFTELYNKAEQLKAVFHQEKPDHALYEALTHEVKRVIRRELGVK